MPRLLCLCRFFYLSDAMVAMGWSCMLHVEGDNMLYGPNINGPNLAASLAEEYRGVAVTPQNRLFATASVMWVSSLEAVDRLTRQVKTSEFNSYHPTPRPAIHSPRTHTTLPLFRTQPCD